MNEMISIPLDELIDFIRSKRVSITSNPTKNYYYLLKNVAIISLIPLRQNSCRLKF